MTPSLYVLILMSWTMSQHAGNGIATAEFTSKERCEAAAQAASDKFDGFVSKTYYVCVPK